jgi:RNA-directed DNA polymerase
MAHDSRDKVRRLQLALAQAAKRSPRRRFQAWSDTLWRWDVLEPAGATGRANRGRGGVDGQTIERGERAGVDSFLRARHAARRAGRSRPCPGRRVARPNASGGTRPLGMPTGRDRVGPAACRLVIEPLFEAACLPGSSGVRPGRRAHQAHRMIRETVNRGSNGVGDGDLVRDFDTLEQARLLALVRPRISDRRRLGLLRRWLKAGVLTADGDEPSEPGTPQGGVISPRRSTISRHGLDQPWPPRGAQLGVLVRDADDVVLRCRRFREAQQSLATVRAVLADLGLTLHPEKTRLVDRSRGKTGFDFLGFHFHKGASWQFRGRHDCLSWPSPRAMRPSRQNVKAVTTNWRRRPLPLEGVVATLNPILRGWVLDFRVGNSRRKFVALDRSVDHRLAVFRRRPWQRRRRGWRAADFRRLGGSRAAGQVAWASPRMPLREGWSERRMRENLTSGLMRGCWKPRSAGVRRRRVRRGVRERLPARASALLYK